MRMHGVPAIIEGMTTIPLPPAPSCEEQVAARSGNLDRYPYIRAYTPSERQTLINLRQELLPFPGGIFVPRALCASAQSRAWILSGLSSPQAVAYRYTALWLHTGHVTSAFERGLEFIYPHQHKHHGEYQPSLPALTITQTNHIGVTTLERTAIDVLLADLRTGTEHMCALVRAGTSVRKIRLLAHQTPHVTGIKRVRDYLDALPNDLDKRISRLRSTRDFCEAQRLDIKRAEEALLPSPSGNAHGPQLFLQ